MRFSALPLLPDADEKEVADVSVPGDESSLELEYNALLEDGELEEAPEAGAESLFVR